MKRGLVWPLVAVGIALVVAACGGGEADEATGATAAQVAAPADLSGVTIEMHQAPG